MVVVVLVVIICMSKTITSHIPGNDNAHNFKLYKFLTYYSKTCMYKTIHVFVSPAKYKTYNSFITTYNSLTSSSFYITRTLCTEVCL